MEQNTAPSLANDIIIDKEDMKRLLLEQHRYKQQCRMRAIELAYSKTSWIIDASVSAENKSEKDPLKHAQEIYNWLTEIIQPLG